MPTPPPRAAGALVLTLLAIELLDELAFGARDAAWPLVRRDLGLDYATVGLLLPVALGAAAGRFGLGPTLWLLCASPVALLVGVPRADAEVE